MVWCEDLARGLPMAQSVPLPRHMTCLQQFHWQRAVFCVVWLAGSWPSGPPPCSSSTVGWWGLNMLLYSGMRKLAPHRSGKQSWCELLLS
jgi:hypothetical protein